VPDVASVAAPVGFLGALVGVLTYLGNAIVSDRKAFAERIADERARAARAEETADRLQDELDSEIRTRRAVERDLATAELEMERMMSRIEGFRERELDAQRATLARRSIQ
jgi:hypothetical protein